MSELFGHGINTVFATHSVLGLDERIVDSDDVDFIMLNAAQR